MDLKLNCNQIRMCSGNNNLVTFFVFDTIYHFDLLNDNLITKYPQCKDVINAGNLRKDGKIIYTGLSTGKLNVYDAGKKNLLRSYNSHKLQVNSIEVSDNLVNFISTSNDLSVKLYDLANLDPVRSYNKAHGDYVKIAKYIDENTFISGGYDKVLKVWDIRSNSKTPTKVFQNQNICNDILILNGSRDQFISTAENYLNLFDLRTDRLILQANPVQGLISKIVSDADQTRLFVVSSGESFIKVVDLQNQLRSLYTIKLGNEVTNFDISEDMSRYAVSFGNGLISIRSRNFEEEEENDIYKDQEEKDLELLE
jgi:WD40 repeat protein